MIRLKIPVERTLFHKSAPILSTLSSRIQKIKTDYRNYSPSFNISNVVNYQLNSRQLYMFSNST